MVALSVLGSVLSRALAFVADVSSAASKPPSFDTKDTLARHTANAVAAIEVLQKTWYSPADGLWNTTGWWNAANCLTALADFANLDPKRAEELSLDQTILNTFLRAQTAAISTAKTILGSSHLPLTHTERLDRRFSASDRLVVPDGFPGFVNDYFDDEGWWALALLRSNDYLHTPGTASPFLAAAQRLVLDMEFGTDTPCSGPGPSGVWWNKDRTYVSAISNELYLAASAALANRLPSSSPARSHLAYVARTQWSWFRRSGLINAHGLVNDGLDNRTCANNGRHGWTYNQGVVLSGLVELSRLTRTLSPLRQARRIAAAAIANMTDANGVLHERCESEEGRCGADGVQFKGIFVRNVGYLYRELKVLDGGNTSHYNDDDEGVGYGDEGEPGREAEMEELRNFVLANADALWSKGRDHKGRMGLVWSGPSLDANAGMHCSGLDALVAAMAVA